MERQVKGSNSSNQALEFLNVQKLRNTLCRISLFIATFESLSDFTTKTLKYFYCDGGKAGCLFLKRYTTEVLHKYKKPKGNTDHFYSCLCWFLSNEAITQQDFNFLIRMRIERDKLVHEMSDYVFSGIPTELGTWHQNLIKIYRKLSFWWIANIEKGVNEDIPDDMDPNKTHNLSLVFLNLLKEVALENEELNP